MMRSGFFIAIKKPEGSERAATPKSTESNRQRSGKAGFTLVEILVSFVIIGALFVILMPYFMNFIEMAKVSRCMSDIRSLEKQITVYSWDNNKLPNSLNDIGRGTLLDPWGNLYKYNAGNVRQDKFLNFLNEDFDLYSLGKDGASQQKISEQQSQDDVVRAGTGAWVGLASTY